MKHRKSWRASGGAPFVDPLFAEELTGRGPERPHGREKADHKTMQLCRQVQRALMLALAGECGDEVLRDLVVDSVVPAPDAAHLLVRVVVPGRAEPVGMVEVMERLSRAGGVLRRSVTEAIVRKRSPELMFVPVMAGEVTP